MRTLSTTAVASLWNELEKIAGEPESLTDRTLQAAPGIGAITGAVAGASGSPKKRLVGAVLGAATGAGVGWLPTVAKDLGSAAMPQKLAGIAKLIPGGIPKITMPKPPSSTQLTAAADVVKPLPSAAKDIKVPGTIRASASTASNVQGLKAPSAIYG